MSNTCINDIDNPMEKIIEKIGELEFPILEFSFKTLYRLPNGMIYRIDLKIDEGCF